MVDLNFNTRTTQTKRLGPIGSIFFALLGLCMLAGAVYFGVKTADLMVHGLHAKGEVVDVVQKLQTKTTHHKGYADTTTQKMYYYPVVKFDDSKKQSRQFQSHTGSGNATAHNKGDTVDVIYFEDDPQGSAIIDEGAANWAVPGILGFMGLIFTLIGAFSFLRALII